MKNPLNSCKMRHQKFSKIVTHAGTHHADEVLAIATVFEFVGKLPIERKNEVTVEELENKEVLVFDIGGRYEPENGNFDHHQSTDIPATNVLVLNHFCDDEKLKANLRMQLFSSVDVIDRGIFPERPDYDFLIPDFNSLIRSMNNSDDGFKKALLVARMVLSAEISKAKKSIRREEIWNSLEKHDGIAIQHTNEPIMDWRELAERDGILLLVSPSNRQSGAYQVVSRDTKTLLIPKTDEQQFRHPSGFMAVYFNYNQAIKYATEIKNAYLYHTQYT
jgi:uncharacterized UPF0160 family protein